MVFSSPLPPFRLLLVLLALPLLLGGCSEPPAPTPVGPLTADLYVIADDDRPEPGAFIRYAPSSPEGGGLDIAVTDYVHPEPGDHPPISLVGVVHIADPLYFEAMQKELDRYDVVLFEGVKEAETTAAEWQVEAKESLGALSGFQRDLASWFGFRFQLDAIDYARDHFQHADMTLEEFREAGGGEFLPLPEIELPEEPEETGPAPEEAAEEDEAEESEDPADALPEAIQSTLASVRAFGELALGKPNPLRSLARRMFAKTMGTTDIGTALEMIPGFADLILYQRNAVVMERLEQVLPDAEGPVAIFYGAAHMEDLEERLAKLGYERAGGRWLRAWALRKPLPRR